MVTLPINQTSPDFQFSCELDARTFTFRLRYDDRSDVWRMDLGDANNVPLALSLALVVNMPILRGLRSNPELPQGEFVVLDTAGTGTDPTYDSIGRQHLVGYLSASEII
jgi:hypothetical protein